jgi:uncharacterized membrane protein
VQYEASIVVKAPLGKAYSAYTDFESIPRWSRQTSAVRIVAKQGDAVRLEATGISGGKDKRAVSDLRLYPQERVESEGETRFTRIRRTVSFAEVPEGTKVTASLEVKMKGKWGWILRTPGKAQAESSAYEELASFATYVQSLS